MTRKRRPLVGVALGLFATAIALAGTVAAAEVKIGYLSLHNDPRHAPVMAYSGIELAPGDDPFKGAELGVRDLGILTQSVGITAVLDEEAAADATGLVAKLQDMTKLGERFVI